MSYLIDTNIIIYSLKGHEQVRQKFEESGSSPKRISLVTYAELLYGAQKSNACEKNNATVMRIKSLFPIIEIDLAVIEVFAHLKAYLSKIGKPVCDFDILIAASALTWNCTLVTHNTKHFEHIAGLQIEDWTL